MAETKRIMRITDEEKKRIMDSSKNEIVPKNSFYTKPDRSSAVSRFDRASIRRAAGVYVQNS